MNLKKNCITRVNNDVPVEGQSSHEFIDFKIGLIHIFHKMLSILFYEFLRHCVL